MNTTLRRSAAERAGRGWGSGSEGEGGGVGGVGGDGGVAAKVRGEGWEGMGEWQRR